MRLKTATIIGGLLLGLIFNHSAFGEWEAGAKVGFDSNVDRSIDGGTSDGFLSVYTALSREPRGESRIDWMATAAVEGSAFAEMDELNSAAVTITPGVTYFPYRAWTIALSPFFQAKAVTDSDQSALAFGGKVDLRQQLRPNLYTGQYYIYTDNRADVDTYSFKEHTVGVFLGINWTRALFTEIGYEFSRGDSFRTISQTSTRSEALGKGRHSRHSSYSTTFETEVIRERVDNHAVGLNLGIGWSKQLFSLVSYTFTATAGDSGSSATHSGFVGTGFRF